MSALDAPSLLNQALLDQLGGLFTVSRDGTDVVVAGRIPAAPKPGLEIDGLRFGAAAPSGQFTLDGLGTSALTFTPVPGFPITLTAFEATLTAGNLTAARISGTLTVPFFTDQNGRTQTVDVEVGVQSATGFTVTLAAQQNGAGANAPEGLVALHYGLPLGASLDLTLSSLSLTVEADGVARLTLAGKLAASAGGIDWPEIEFQALRIDSRGRVEIAGGAISLPARVSVDYFGFHLGLQQLSLGTNAAQEPVLAFNGDLHLVEGIPLGGSVRGLEVNLKTGAVAFAGVEVSFEIPDVLKFDGSIDHIHFTATSAADLPPHGLPAFVYGAIPSSGSSGKEISVFAGGVSCTIEAAGGLEIDAQLLVGNFNGLSIFFLSLDAELPVGIPIFLDVSLFGVHGLFASNLRPEPGRSTRPDGEPCTWWDWYKYPPGGTGGIDASREPPPPPAALDPGYFDATDPHKWLVPLPGAFALGAGATIGTSADNGYAVSASITFALLLPGPVVMLIGKARVLSGRATTGQDSGVGLSLDALAALDFEAETFDLDIEARYQIPVLLDVEGGAALHVDRRTGVWYFALGLPPHDRRVRARVFDLFEADAYFVISNRGVALGAYIGYAQQVDLGPVNVGFNFFLATIAAAQWSPLQLGGGIELHGDAHLSFFGLSMGLGVDALLEASAPNPFWIHGEFTVTIELPWPLPDIHASVSLTWGSDTPPPPTGANLTRVEAVMADHAGVSDRYDLVPVTPAPAPTAGPPPGVPVVPPDAHFVLHFARPTVDDNGLFAAAAQVPPDPPTAVQNDDLLPADDMSQLNLNPTYQWVFRHKLEQVVLSQWNGTGWIEVARAQTGNAGSLKGAWLAPDQSTGGQILGPSINTRVKFAPLTPVATGALAVLPGIGSPTQSAVYRLQVQTAADARRTDQGDFQSAPEDGGSTHAIFFATAGAPGTADRVGAPASPSVFPNGGALLDLDTYLTWAWPEDGAAAAYYSYDVSFEFNEPYVHRLYADRGRGEAGESLHFRCTDRSGRWIMLDPFEVQAPALPPNAGLVAEVLAVAQPPAVAQGTDADAANARLWWPDQFRPRTRYTIDLVVGPATFDGLCLASATAAEAAAELQDLRQDEGEQALPPLARVQFSTSRYATFTAHLAHAVGQTGFRRYLLDFDPTAWFASVRGAAADATSYTALQAAYQGSKAKLTAIVSTYNPLGDVLNPLQLGQAGPSGLRQRRQDVAGAWASFGAAVAGLFDSFVAKLRRPDLVSTAHAPAPPDTEVSLLVGRDGVARAVLLESPEPLDWRRLAPVLEPLVGGIPVGLTPLWNIDATRAVLIPIQAATVTNFRLDLTFQGDIQCEAPAITHCGDPIRETVSILLSRTG